MNIKAIIVDDEFLARQRILKLLEVHDDIEVVAEAKNAEQAIDLIHEREPDLLFLDIQMPGHDGFYVLSKLSLKKLPVIIFTTAYDQFALDAFQVNALDYLLKPFEQERFDESVSRAKEQLKLERTSVYNQHVQNLIDSVAQESAETLRTFMLKDKGREIYVKVDDVQFLESAGNYVVLHTSDQQYVYRATMNQMESSLDKEEFLRIHRSFLVNRRFVKSYQYLTGNEFSFQMKNGKTLRSAKSQKPLITQFMDLYFVK
ncbi:LytTR family DNA-binding domain-containing protein [Roseivirga sp. E12]|uniref:LytR/AlgR family response regulator transcription factor n=1 Tax=Roseivirga sp. E12 TaxID=2819237 RepID=UPI001ABD24AA|nr:LytTR family DNA-binding domain-containing protein [Roseivirga sp. E12]MBO3699585.1 response regulator transcription factor [Roseivirga sp. E12]